MPFTTFLGDDANNLSNSTLRRKLFEGAMEDECEQSDEENENNPDTPVNDLENCNDKQNTVCRIMFLLAIIALSKEFINARE